MLYFNMKGQMNMEKQEIVWNLIEEHNNSIDEYITFILPSKLRCEGYEVVDGRVACRTKINCGRAFL